MKSNYPHTTRPRTPLVEGEDFYWEGSLMVLTRAHHLKRGYCCDSGCRHCPYRAGKSKVTGQQVEGLCENPTP
jgi:hypothetical protein